MEYKIQNSVIKFQIDTKNSFNGVAEFSIAPRKRTGGNEHSKTMELANRIRYDDD